MSSDSRPPARAVSVPPGVTCPQGRLRTLVRDEALGEVHAIRGHYLQSWKLTAEDTDWRRDPRRAGVSPVLFDIGTHLIDLVEHVAGRPATHPYVRPAATPS